MLGESSSPGFAATAVGGDGEEHDLGTPTLVNGYANGWLVDPAVVGADATITMEFTPQRMVWVALVLSALGVVLCGVLLVLRTPRVRGVPDGAQEPVTVRPLGVLAGTGEPLDTARAAGVSALLGAAAWVFMGWSVGAVVLAAAFCGLRLRRGQVVVRSAGIVLFGAAAAFVVLKQLRGDYLVDFNWMNLFEVTHAWTLAAVALLVVDVVVDRLRRNRFSEAVSGTPRTAPGSGP